MKRLRAWASRLAGFFTRARGEREMADEIESHLQLHIDDNLRAGLTPAEARRQAMIKLGGVQATLEAYRDRRTIPAFEHVAQDLRFAIRQLRRSPGFTATAILMLALGMAASVAIFAFVDAALIAPLPYADQSRLVLAYTTGLNQRGRGGMVSYLDYRDWRNQQRAFRSIDVYDVRGGSTLTTSAGAEKVSSLTVTAGFFRTLGVTPLLGRDFRDDEEGNAAPATVMLAFGAWQTRFGGRPEVVGQTVTLDGEPHLVIGILPRGFHFTLMNPADFWVTVRGGNYCRGQRDCRSMLAIARLADGVGLAAASADLQSVTQRLREQYPRTNTDISADLTPLREAMLGNIRPLLVVLLSGAGLLLLIACINVVSLLLVRSEGRAREVAVRDALGASSARLVWQFATEALVLVAAGGGFGLLLATWGMHFLASLLSAEMLGQMPYLQEVGFGARIATFAAAVALGAAVAFALAPIARLTRSARFAGLKDGSRGAANTTWRRVGAHLVVVELAIAVVLLVGAGLLGRSLQRLLHVDIGLNPDRLAVLSVSVVPDATTRTEALPTPDLALARQVAERLSALPGVERVGYADQLPLSRGDAPTTNFQVPGRPLVDEARKSHPIRRVSAGYFATLGARLVRGRELTEAEVAASQPVVVINETTADRYFPGEDPVGREFQIGTLRKTIVGVVADLKDGPLETPARPAVYVPFDQTGFALVVRTSQPIDVVAGSLTSAIRGIRSDVIVSPVGTMADQIDRLPSAYLHRSSAWLVGGFAAMAFLLSVVGLYGVVAYSVSQRNREIGVRMALGAHAGSVYRLVLGEAGWLTGAGIAIGLICAVAVASLMRGLLFGVESWDVTTLVSVTVALTTSALLASYVPARRAASVNPVEALRAE
jgi:macrolide transport system ATP-binding/permease protein